MLTWPANSTTTTTTSTSTATAAAPHESVLSRKRPHDSRDFVRPVAADARYPRLSRGTSIGRKVAPSAEARFWRGFRSPVVETLSSGMPVTDISFCPVAPYDFVATSATRVLLYSSVTKKVKAQFARFADVAYSGRLRPTDGKLLAAGCAGSTGKKAPRVKVFTSGTSTKTLLREFEGHQGDVRVVRWSEDGKNIFSASDDRTAKLWDLASNACISSVDGHGDYVRCGERFGPDTWFTGCGDGIIRLWDFRVSASSGPIMKLSSSPTHRQGTSGSVAAISALLPLPGGTLLMAAAGNEITVWDVLGGGRQLKKLPTAHQRTVSAMCLDGGSTSQRVCAGDMDGYVKVYDISSSDYSLVHGLRFNHPVLSIGMSRDNGRIAVGLSNGTLHLRSRDVRLGNTALEAARNPEEDAVRAMQKELERRRRLAREQACIRRHLSLFQARKDCQAVSRRPYRWRAPAQGKAAPL